MVTIKDFKKGDKAYSLLKNTGRNSAPEICEVTVESVGRTYVTTGNGNPWSRKYMNDDSEFLLEKVDYGEAQLLFRTKEDAENFIEKCNLAIWLGCLSIDRAEKYSLEQLRKVKEILEPGAQ